MVLLLKRDRLIVAVDRLWALDAEIARTGNNEIIADSAIVSFELGKQGVANRSERIERNLKEMGAEYDYTVPARFGRASLARSDGNRLATHRNADSLTDEWPRNYEPVDLSGRNTYGSSASRSPKPMSTNPVQRSRRRRMCVVESQRSIGFEAVKSSAKYRPVSTMKIAPRRREVGPTG